MPARSDSSSPLHCGSGAQVSSTSTPRDRRRREAVGSAASPLVSVIVPAYNAEDYVGRALASITSQTVDDLEIVAVDDASSDGTAAELAAAAERDRRITVVTQQVNRGAAAARNRALSMARGAYIAYLDADDEWLPTKLERQISFMERTGAGACFTSYETIERDGSHRNVVHVPASIGYDQFLKNTITCSHTLLFDTRVVDRALLVMPDLRRGQDAATWLAVMKAGHRLHGLDECLARYRKAPGSLSSSKIKAVRRTWNLYRRVEGLSLPYAAYCLCWQLFHALLKRRKEAS